MTSVEVIQQIAPKAADRATARLFGAVTFLSAFLLFLIQPLIARALLPWFGGSAAVWATCLMFFQAALVAGYAYAHLSVRLLSARRQAALHIALLALASFALPVLPSVKWKPAGGSAPEWAILVILAATVGAPYTLLAATSPMLQAWFARTRPEISTYALYALSNGGSLLGLLAYPLAIEPAMRLRIQGAAWSVAYVIFAALCAALAMVVRRRSDFSETTTRESSASAPPSSLRKLLWASLAFCPSVLLLAVTVHITHDIAPIPLLWVVPLSLYLLTFVIAFGPSTSRWYSRDPWFTVFIGGALLLQFTSAQSALGPATILLVCAGSLAAFFCCALVCNSELYRLRPEPAHLTTFYFMISVGGALGGIFVSLLAPVLFNRYFELPLALLGCVALMAILLRRDSPSIPGRFGRRIEYALLLIVACSISASVGLTMYQPGIELARRNFYGALRVSDKTAGHGPVRVLLHGKTVHGVQFTNPADALIPTSYYAPSSGIGRAIASRPHPVRVGVIGLGAGTIAAYSRPGDVYDFYEINPLVLDIARTRFDFLARAQGRVEVILGDARLSLERESPRGYDVLAVDAFSGDSIPVHLMTVEAFREYFRHTSADGIVAAHVSNRYLNLIEVVSRIAAVLGKPAVLIETQPDTRTASERSIWVLVGNQADAFAPPLPVPGRGATPWTDDYVNLIAALAIRVPGK